MHQRTCTHSTLIFSALALAKCMDGSFMQLGCLFKLNTAGPQGRKEAVERDSKEADNPPLARPSPLVRAYRLGCFILMTREQRKRMKRQNEFFPLREPVGRQGSFQLPTLEGNFPKSLGKQVASAIKYFGCFHRAGRPIWPLPLGYSQEWV